MTIELYNILNSKINSECKILGIDIDPVLIERAKEKNKINEIRFQCLDIMDDKNTHTILKNYLLANNSDKFSVTFCFSVTMWIHLNHGDEGLENFIRTLCKISEHVLVEPQPWKCYKTAVKRMKQQNEEFSHFKHLKIRGENVENSIENLFVKYGAVKIYESEKTEWHRKLQMFKCNMQLNKI